MHQLVNINIYRRFLLVANCYVAKLFHYFARDSSSLVQNYKPLHNASELTSTSIYFHIHSCVRVLKFILQPHSSSTYSIYLKRLDRLSE